MAFPLERWYFEIPIITRAFITISGAITIAEQLSLVHWLRFHYSYDMIFRQGQYWRLLTTFVYFGPLSLDWFFHMYFMVRYSRMLEEGVFRGRTADYAWMLIVSAALLLLSELLVRSLFLGSQLAYVLVYVWSRREMWVRMNFLGLFDFHAPYLPWVLLGFSALLNGAVPYGQLIGIGIGHIYYFFTEIWPREGGRRWLATPWPMLWLFNELPTEHGLDDADVVMLPYGSDESDGSDDDDDDERPDEPEWTEVPRPHQD